MGAGSSNSTLKVAGGVCLLAYCLFLTLVCLPFSSCECIFFFLDLTLYYFTLWQCREAEGEE